jgi:hypothetical protein
VSSPSHTPRLHRQDQSQVSSIPALHQFPFWQPIRTGDM